MNDILKKKWIRTASILIWVLLFITLAVEVVPDVPGKTDIILELGYYYILGSLFFSVGVGIHR